MTMKLFNLNQPGDESTVSLPPLDRVIRTGRLLVSPPLARRILDEANYDRQRRVSPVQIQRAVDLIGGTQWVDDHQIWFAKLGDQIHLVDGQHRLSAIWLTGAAKVFQAQVVEVSSQEAVHDLYSRFDRFGRKRTDAELLTSLGFAEGLGVSRLLARAAFRCAPILASDFIGGKFGSSGPVPTDQDKVAYLEPWSELIAEYDRLLEGAETDLGRALKNPGIVALALVTLRDQRLKATKFWGDIAQDDGLRKGEPQHTLVVALRNRSFKGSGMDGAKTAAVAWNAFYNGRKLSLIRVHDDAEIRIDGVKRAKK